MKTPFDEVVEEIKTRRYHNHRLQVHSNIVGRGIFRDLLERCSSLRRDYEENVVGMWLNVKTPGARGRKVDMLIGEPFQDRNAPDLRRIRICVENKSVVTAHRNSDARYDDLNESLQVLHGVKPEAVLVATIMIGLAERVLNVPDVIKKMYRGRVSEFESKILPRLSSGDNSLWEDFPSAISKNRHDDPFMTTAKFHALPKRRPAHTHERGYDSVLLVPVLIDNVNPPVVARDNPLHVDVDREYLAMLEAVCKAYQARWHV